MKIAVASLGRFHVLDLARELGAFGHDVAFYSYVPESRAVRFGLSKSQHRSLLPWMVPWLLIQRFGPSGRRASLDRLLLERLDALIARRLEPCDVFIGMSGLCVESARAAKKLYGARVFIERGSKHIVAQKNILENLAKGRQGASRVPSYAVERELASYELADSIVVPAAHVVESFVEHGVPINRLFVNPYGVDLDMFSPTPAPAAGRPVVLHVGAWSIRKGCDYILDVVKSCERDAVLLHVGGIGDAPLLSDAAFIHHEPVPQWQLREFYARAHVLCLASREEGLSLVQAQALACGAAIVCTDQTGGSDLKRWVSEPEAISVVKAGDSVEMARNLGAAIDWTQRRFAPGVSRDLLGRNRRALSWHAYGERYHKKIEEVVSTLCGGGTCSQVGALSS